MSPSPHKPRKLHIPRNGDAMRPAPTPPPAPREEPPLPGCVQPRGRFVRRFLLVCALFSIAGLLVFAIRKVYPEEGLPSLLFVPALAMWAVPLYIPLLSPARSSRGSLLQLLGLLFPLLQAIWACSICWSKSADSLAYGMGFAWIALLAAFWCYLPIWLLHALLGFIEKRRRRQVLTKSPS